MTFLESMSDDLVVIATKKSGKEKENKKGHNLTIVGDWFKAETISAELGQGYQQTIFTRHAPTVQGAMERFDIELYDLLEQKKVSPEESRDATIKEIEGIILGLNSTV